MDLLPEVRAEDLYERNLQRGNLPVHEDARQVELDLEADVHLRGASYSLETVRTASKSQEKPPTSIIPGDESHQQSEGAATLQNAEIARSRG